MKDSTRASGAGRIDWQAARDRVDLASIATSLLGPAAGRAGERGRRLWWRCPFHDDPNPSFCVDPGKLSWKCFGCGERGDAANMMMRLEGVSFPEAVAYLTGGPAPSGTARTRPRPSARSAPKPPTAPSGMPEGDALALVAEAEARLWSHDGVQTLAYLTGPRCLSLETIRVARLGWSPGVRLATKDGRTYSASGVLVPWFDGDRLCLAKIRQAQGVRPKYAEVFRDRPSLYPGPGAIRPGRPLIIVEGEFDCRLLAQELGDLASVVTLGSASARLDATIRGMMRPASPWLIATDRDQAGERAAEGWPARARRVRPPQPYKDWSEATQGGVNLRRWWEDRLAGNESPPLFIWPEMVAWPGLDPEPGLDVDRPDPARRRLALEFLGDGPGDAFEGDLPPGPSVKEHRP